MRRILAEPTAGPVARPPRFGARRRAPEVAEVPRFRLPAVDWVHLRYAAIAGLALVCALVALACARLLFGSTPVRETLLLSLVAALAALAVAGLRSAGVLNDRAAAGLAALVLLAAYVRGGPLPALAAAPFLAFGWRLFHFEKGATLALCVILAAACGAAIFSCYEEGLRISYQTNVLVLVLAATLGLIAAAVAV